jgi:hypothetical protein
MRAERLPAIRRKPHTLERIKSFGVGQAENLTDAQAPCRRADKEMLCQGVQSLVRDGPTSPLWKSSARRKGTATVQLYLFLASHSMEQGAGTTWVGLCRAARN